MRSGILSRIDFRQPKIDIFTAGLLLEELLETYQLNDSEQRFIGVLHQKLSDPMEDLAVLRRKIRAKLNSSQADQIFYRPIADETPLKSHRFHRNPDVFDSIYSEELEEKQKHPSSQPISYRDILNCILICIAEAEKTLRNLKSDAFVHAEKYDSLYQTTMAKYKGSIVLPIRQKLDFRQGASAGACHAYQEKWLISLLNNKKPFGIDPHRPPVFRLIKFNSPAGRQYPDLNHLAPLTKTMSLLQNLSDPEISQHKNEQHDLTEPPVKQVVSPFEFHGSSSEIADALVHQANKNINGGFKITLRGLVSGNDNFLVKENQRHSLGFKKFENGECHFIDANAGWFSFSNETNFKKWLPFYFKTMSYDHFQEFRIISYSQPKSNNHTIEFLEKEILGYALLRAFYYTALKLSFFFQRISNAIASTIHSMLPEHLLSQKKSEPAFQAPQKKRALEETTIVTSIDDFHIKPEQNKEPMKVQVTKDDMNLEKDKKAVGANIVSYQRIADSLKIPLISMKPTIKPKDKSVETVEIFPRGYQPISPVESRVRLK